MTKSITLLLLSTLLFSCSKKKETIKATVETISESVYASGTIKSKQQYQVFAGANGIIKKIFVNEGDPIKKGDPILSLSGEMQRLNRENAALNARFADLDANQGKVNEAKLILDVASNKLKVDSALYFRQQNLWKENVGSKVELEQKELLWQNAKSAYFSAQVRYNDLLRQLNLNDRQTKNNLQISSELSEDFTIKSEIDGIVYGIYKNIGEMVSVQTPVAVVGEKDKFILEMQVDEYDILKIKLDQTILVTMDSYKGKVFQAKVTKINPLMNERSKSFMVEAEFTNGPDKMYPNITFEANILLQTKDKALLLPRSYVQNDSIVYKSNGDKITVKTGLKDYQKIEILSGVTAEDEIIKPLP